MSGPTNAGQSFETTEDTGAASVSVVGVVDSSNSTTIPLGADEVFTGEPFDVLNYGIYFVSVFSDVASSSDSLSIQQSHDGANWDHTDDFAIPANKGKNFSINPFAKWARVEYKNGPDAQSIFRLQAVAKGNSKPSSHRIQDSIIDDDDAELMKSVITGQGPDSIFRNVKTNIEQAISVTNFLVEVSRGNIPGMKLYNIPGRKDSISAVALDDLTQIPGTIVAPEPGGIQLQVVSSNAGDTSGGTGVREIDIHYLDTAGLEQEEMITMNGLTPVNTVATDIDFVQWAHTRSVGSNGVSLGNISITDITATTIYEYITAGGNQSLSGRVKVPADKTGFVMGWQATGVTKKIDVRLRATVERFDRSLLPGIFLFQDNLLLNDSTSGWIPFDAPLRMPCLAVVKMSAISFVAGGDAGGAFTILLIDNP